MAAVLKLLFNELNVMTGLGKMKFKVIATLSILLSYY